MCSEIDCVARCVSTPQCNAVTTLGTAGGFPLHCSLLMLDDTEGIDDGNQTAENSGNEKLYLK